MTRTILTVALGACILFLAACAAGPQPRLDADWVAQTEAHLQAQRFQEARDLAQQALDGGKDSPGAWYLLGLAKDGLGDAAGGVEAYRETVQRAPDFADGWANMARLLLSEGRVDEMAEPVEALERLEPGSVETPLLRAEMARLGGDDQAMRTHLQEALRRQPAREDLRLQVAALHLAGGAPAESLACLEAAPEPRGARIWATLGRLHLDAGRPEQAQTCYEAALKVDPDLGEACTALGVLLRRAGEEESAREHLERGLALDPEDPWTLYQVARLDHDQGRLDEALPRYRAALAGAPKLAEGWYDLGRLLAGRGETDEAVSAFDRALALRPDHLETVGQKAMALAEGGRLDEALPLLRRFVRDAPAGYEPFVEQMQAWIEKAEAR